MSLNPFFCAILHVRYRTVLLPGILPFKLDAVSYYCSKCDNGKGPKPRVPSLRRSAAAFSAGAA